MNTFYYSWYDIRRILIAQAKLTAYYNGATLPHESVNHPGRELWWDYLTNDSRKYILDLDGSICCRKCDV